MLYTWSLHSEDVSKCVAPCVLGSKTKVLVLKTIHKQQESSAQLPHAQASFTPDVLVVETHEEKSFKDADRKVRVFSPTETA